MPTKRTLHICRHGKSGWDYGGVRDIDRPLSERGIKDSIAMANRFYQRFDKPDLIVSSPAARASHTALIYARELEIPINILTFNIDIYEAFTSELIRIVTNLPDDKTNVMIFGHNPGFTDLANNFIDDFIDNIPTAGIVSITFECEHWKDINRKQVKSHLFDFPKNS